jgi:hypothetical protein
MYGPVNGVCVRVIFGPDHYTMYIHVVIYYYACDENVIMNGRTLQKNNLFTNLRICFLEHTYLYLITSVFC